MSRKRFEDLVHEHGRQVLNTALRVLGDVNLANDVHQEVFLAVWRRWEHYNGQVNWTAYLYRVTVRKALELAAGRSRGSACDDGTPELPAHGAGPEGALAAEELRQKLAAALTRLPKRQAETFVLLRLEGLGTAQAAEMLGCSEETVRVHLHRALRRLSRQLSKYRS